MKITKILSCGFGLVLTLAVACNSAAPTATVGLSEADVAATIDAAIRATSTASAELSATIAAAVRATGSAIAPETTPTPTVTMPTPKPTEVSPTLAVDTSHLTEEELTTAIDAAVADAVAAAEQAVTSTTDATADGAITDDETANIETAISGVQEAVALAEALIAAYGGQYGEYALETMAVLLDIKEDLETVAEATLAVLALIEQGSGVASAAIEQIEAILEITDINIADIQAKVEGWAETLQNELENRVDDLLSVQPSRVANNRDEAIEIALQYIETVRSALVDGNVSQEELSAIALAGANAVASLQAQGGPALKKLVDSINSLTTQIAEGEWLQVQAILGLLETALSRLP